MEVFKNEGNVSQDANFRAHLDDNWDSGNREFDKVEGKLRIALDDIQFLKTEIHDLQGDVKALTEKHNEDIKALTDKHNDDIKAVQEQLDRLNNVVFGHVHEVNYDKIPEQNNNDHEVNHRDPMNKDPSNHELNYYSVNGKHRFVEIDTTVNHKLKGE